MKSINSVVRFSPRKVQRVCTMLRLPQCTAAAEVPPLQQLLNRSASGGSSNGAAGSSSGTSWSDVVPGTCDEHPVLLCSDRGRQNLFSITSLSPIEATLLFSLRGGDQQHGKSSTAAGPHGAGDTIHSFFLMPHQKVAVVVTSQGRVCAIELTTSRLVGECALRQFVSSVNMIASLHHDARYLTFELLVATFDDESKIGEALLLDIHLSGSTCGTDRGVQAAIRSSSGGGMNRSFETGPTSLAARFSVQNLFRIRGRISAFAVRRRRSCAGTNPSATLVVRDVFSVSASGNVDVWCVEEQADRTAAYGSLELDASHGSPSLGKGAALVVCSNHVRDGEEDAAGDGEGNATLWIGTSRGDTVVFTLPSSTAIDEASNARGVHHRQNRSTTAVTPNTSTGVASTTVTLSHHRAPVEQISQLSLGRQVWTCCRNGVVAVWDALSMELRGSFEMRDSAPLSSALQVGWVNVQTQLWAIDSLGGITLWDVKEGVEGNLMAAPDRANRSDSKQQPRSSGKQHLRDSVGVDADDYEALVEHLSSLLGEASAASDGRGTSTTAAAAKSAMKREYTVPTTIEEKYPDAVFLPDAVMSLTDCRHMLAQTFADMGWEKRSFNEDVFAVLSALAATRRKGQRAAQVAAALSRLCPAFPLPQELSDPFDQLITSAECVLEEVADKGRLVDPSARNNFSSHNDSSEGGRTPVAARGLGRGGGPMAAVDTSVASSETTPRPAAAMHVYETQLANLDQKLADALRALRAAQEDIGARDDVIHQLEGETTELQRFAESAMAKEKKLHEQLERLEMSSVAAKQSTERSHHDVIKLESEVDRCHHEIESMNDRLQEVESDWSEKLDAANTQLQAKDQLVRELTAYVKQQAFAIEELTGRGDQAHEEMCRLREDVLHYQQRESKGKRLLATANATFDETHRSLRELMDEVRRASSTSLRLSENIGVAQRLDEILQRLEQRFHDARTSVRSNSSSNTSGGEEHHTARANSSMTARRSREHDGGVRTGALNSRKDDSEEGGILARRDVDAETVSGLRRQEGGTVTTQFF